MTTQTLWFPASSRGVPRAPATPSRAFAQYQGGLSFTVFSAQGSNPVVNCKISGKYIQKIYDKSVKGYVYTCSGGMSSKIQFPKDEKLGLQLVQPYLVLQIFVPKGQHFSLELRATDTQNTRRKMYFSTSFSEIKATPLHCQIPLSMIMRNTWLTLALHVPDLFHSCFRVMSFRSTDVILLGPVCKLRKIFTMRNRLAQSFTEVKPNEEWLPAEHMFAVGVEASIQVIDTEKLQNIMGTTLNVEGKQDAAPALLSARKLCSNRADRHVHVAFGSRMPLPLSTVQINTNLPHDVKLASTNEHTQSLPTSTLSESHPKIGHFKGVEPLHCPTKTSVTAVERQVEVKKSTVKAVSPLARMWDVLNFPVQEEPQVENLETRTPLVEKCTTAVADMSLVDRCPDLISKQGQKLLKLHRRKEEKHYKRNHQSARNSQKENPFLNKCRETKDFELNDSPPESPPSGWGNNSQVGSDSFPFDRHLDEGLPFLDTTSSSPDCSESIQKLSGVSFTHTDIIHEDFQNEHALSTEDPFLKTVESPLDKQRAATPTFREEPDNWVDGKVLENLSLQESKVMKNTKIHDRFDQELNNVKQCSSSSLYKGSAEMPVEKGLENAPIVSFFEKLTDQTMQGSRIGTSGPSSSTEELWVVHEEEDVNDSVPGVPKGHGGFQKSGTLLSAPANSVSNAHAATTQSSKLSPVYSSSVPKLGLSTQETNYAASTEQMRPVLSNLQCSLLPSKSQISNLKECPASSSATADKELELLYDPILDCYYDPKTNRYYELK